MTVQEHRLDRFSAWLRTVERSSATVEKHRREAAHFAAWLDGRGLARETSRTRKSERLLLVLEAICATGIRVSGLRFFTVEAVRLADVLGHFNEK